MVVGRGITQTIGRKQWVCLTRQAAGHSALTADCMKQEEKRKRGERASTLGLSGVAAHGCMKEEKEDEEDSTHLGEDLERELLGGRREWLAVEQAAQGQKRGGHWVVLAACMRLLTQQLFTSLKSTTQCTAH